MTTATIKRCPACDRELDVSDFYTDRSQRDGLSSSCRSCKKARQLNYCAKNREREAERVRAWRARQPPKPPRRLRTDDEKRAVRLAWEARNADRLREQQRARYLRDPKAALMRVHQRKARIAGATIVPVTGEGLCARAAMFGGRCWICGDEATTWDHVKPLAAGGAHALANLRPACARCNRTKAARWPFPTQRRWSVRAYEQPVSVG